MSKKIKLILFGAGLVGRKVLPRYMRKYNVLAIADNDPAKQGKTLFGVHIISAVQIVEYDFDYILLTSTSASQIYDQLLEVGVSPENIKETADVRGPRFPWDAVLFLIFCPIVLIVLICSFLLTF